MAIILKIFVILLSVNSILFAQNDSNTIKNLLKSNQWDEIINLAKKDKVVNFYTWWGEETFILLGYDFEKRYGIKVNIILQREENIIAKALTEKKLTESDIDIVFNSEPAHIIPAIENNLYMSGLEYIPGWDEIFEYDKTYQKNIYTRGIIVPIYKNQIAFLYNPGKLKNPPVTWSQFENFITENPKKFIFCAEGGRSGNAFKYAAMLNNGVIPSEYRLKNHIIDYNTPGDWEKLWQWFQKNFKNYKLSNSNYSSIRAIETGEALLTIAFEDDTYIMKKKGHLTVPIKMYIPEFGLYAASDGVAIMENAKHKAAAVLFISYLLEKNTQIAMRKTLGTYYIREDMQYAEPTLIPEKERKNNKTPRIDPMYYIKLESDFRRKILRNQ